MYIVRRFRNHQQQLKPYYYYHTTTILFLRFHHHQKTPPKPNKIHHHQRNPTNTMKSVEEADVGILCYISQLPGFRGILKQRYSDFVVNEVDLDGNVVHLTSLEAPPEIVEQKEANTSVQPNTSYESEIESFRAIAGDADANSLEEFIHQINSGDGGSVSPVILSPSSDKTHRTSIHKFFKEKLKFLVTDTVDGPETSSKCIRVRLNSGDFNGRGQKSKKRKERGEKPYDSRGSEDWPEDRGKFLRFHLCKENKDTQEALSLIGKMLGVQQRSFGFSGTKDKRSVSTQRVTVFRQHASRVAALNKRLIGIKVGDFCYVNDGLLLGQLYGNRFTITLRGVMGDSEEIIRAAAGALGTHGFINYFGLQRFGSGSIPTHLIGAKLLKGEWNAAVSMILDPREGEKDEVRRVREYYKKSGDIEGILRQLPRYLVAERAILQCLAKCPGNYLQALKAIPRTLRMMYVHSYQSFLWNQAASVRVQKYGIKQVALGDLVYLKEENSQKVKQAPDFNCEEETCNDELENSHLDEVVDTNSFGERSTSVKVVNEEDIASGIYTVDDIVLPLPGSRVIYPSNDVGNSYKDMADKDAISLTECVHSTKEFSLTSLTGAYRRVFQKVEDFEWELLQYTDPNAPLSATDLDNIAKNILNPTVVNGQDNNDEDGNNPRSLKQQSAETSNSEKVPSEAECEGAGSTILEAQLALKLSFTLPSSSYATMAIRELLKTSTSVSYHKTLN